MCTFSVSCFSRDYCGFHLPWGDSWNVLFRNLFQTFWWNKRIRWKLIDYESLFCEMWRFFGCNYVCFMISLTNILYACWVFFFLLVRNAAIFSPPCNFESVSLSTLLICALLCFRRISCVCFLKPVDRTCSLMGWRPWSKSRVRPWGLDRPRQPVKNESGLPTSSNAPSTYGYRWSATATLSRLFAEAGKVFCSRWTQGKSDQEDET